MVNSLDFPTTPTPPTKFGYTRKPSKLLYPYISISILLAPISLRSWVARLFTSCFTRWATVDAIYSWSGCTAVIVTVSTAPWDLIFRGVLLQYWIHTVYLILALLVICYHMDVDFCDAERRAWASHVLALDDMNPYDDSAGTSHPLLTSVPTYIDKACLESTTIRILAPGACTFLDTKSILTFSYAMPLTKAAIIR